MDRQEELTGIERSLWTNDGALYEETYAPEAILIFPEVGRIGLEQALEAIRAENAAGRHRAEVAFVGVGVTRIASDVELLTYEATARWNDEKNPARTLCATLYARRGDIWRVLFHQQIPASEREAATMDKRKSGAKGIGGDSPSSLIDARIKELKDWRGETLARIRSLIREADPDIVEEVKWRKPSNAMLGVPV